MNSILKEEGWIVFEDESNDSDKFLRNRIRKKILPFLKEEGMNPNKVYENFHNTEEILFDLEDSISNRLNEKVKIYLNSISQKQLLFM